jgi:hypothetical protein
MFTLTVDQIDSRGTAEDAVAPILADRAAWRARGAVLGPDRTAGDEFQLVYEDAASALTAALLLRRSGPWSVGIGVGEVETPLPATTGAGRGEAFVAARAAVDAAKRSPHRLAVAATDAERAEGVTALIGLLLEVRSRRSPEGWEVADLLADGLSQVAIAERLGVTPQAISLRARAAAVRLEREALPALERALGDLDVVG